MNNESPDCDDYQIALEMALHAVSPPISTQELEGHLAECDECSAYRALSRDIEPLLDSPPLAVDFERLHYRVGRLRLRRKLERWLFVPLFYAVILAISIYEKDLVMTILMLVCTAPLTLAIVRRDRTVGGLNNPSQEGLVATMRSELHKDAQLLRFTSICFPVAMILAGCLLPAMGYGQIDLPVTVLLLILFIAFIELDRRVVVRQINELG